MKNFILGIIIVFAVGFGCSPKQRFDRLIKNHPYLVQTTDSVIKDTLYKIEIKSDTVKINEVVLSLDTIYQIIDKLPEQSFSFSGGKQKAKDKIALISKLQKDCLYLKDSLIYEDKLLSIKMSVVDNIATLKINKKPQLVKTKLIPEKKEYIWQKDAILWFLFFVMGFLTYHFIILFYDNRKSV
jgi:hypothetical protein